MVTQDNDQDLPPPPYNLTLMKGMKSYKLPRKFVAFVLNHPVAQNFLLWYKPNLYNINTEVVAEIMQKRSNRSASWFWSLLLDPDVLLHRKSIFVLSNMQFVCNCLCAGAVKCLSRTRPPCKRWQQSQMFLLPMGGQNNYCFIVIIVWLCNS